MPWLSGSHRIVSTGKMRGPALLAIFFPCLLVAAPDFEKEVAPILETHCLSCHDEAHAKGDVRLDRREHLLKVIQQGTPEDHTLLSQITGSPPAMPKKGAPLRAEAVTILQDWIKAGAPWPEGRILKDNPVRDLDWWSLRPIESKSELTTVDAFLEQSLQAKGLTPLGQADAGTLLRRLTYDLTGLPPTLAELEAFSVDDYAATVDRLLASPAFGEKWAQHWLDLARYGETHGYDKDKPRTNAWPYRDYVIRAFQEDKPYDRFVQEQIAGDVLFPGEPDGILGLGFLAAGPWDLIGHTEVGEDKVDGRIAKHLDRDEMIGAVGNVFVSTTVQCAQCHHHKFDPVKMEDYYRLHAVFAAVDRADRVYEGLSPEQEAQLNELRTKVTTLKTERDRIDSDTKRSVLAKASGIDRRLTELKEKHGSPLLPQYGWHSAISNQQDNPKWVQIDLGSPKGVEQMKLIPAYDDYNDIGAGFGFPLRYRVEGSNDPAFQKDVRLLKDATAEDQENPRNREVIIDVGGAALRYFRITATRLAPRKGDFIFALGEVETLGGEGHDNIAPGAVVTSLDSIEAPPRWGRANLTDEVFHREADDPKVLAEMRDLEDQRSKIEAEVKTPEVVAQLAKLNEEINALEPKVSAFPRGELVYAAATNFTTQGRFRATAGQARPIHLLNRGDIGNPGDLMQPGMMPLWMGASSEFALPADAPEGQARAELARAISSPDNPLLWRSIANRLWQWSFGKPLVGTPNDFGRMGLPPSHPELLDFLAAKLRDDPNHSLKAIVRLLVTSQAYRRSSAHDETMAALDADNALLWRANRRRLTAEELRDTMLAVSGKLRLEERGGPSFQDFVIEKPQHSPHYQYHLHDPGDPASHRRSIYRMVVRSQPQPFLTSLDCADPSLSVAQRDESTTALQALTQWNNRLVEALAQDFANRLATESASPEEQIKIACQMALGRLPSVEETQLLAEHLQSFGGASFTRVVLNLNALAYLD